MTVAALVAAALAGVDPRDIGQQQLADGVLAALERPHANEVRHGHGQAPRSMVT